MSAGSTVVSELIRVRPWDGLVHLGSLCSAGFAPGYDIFFSRHWGADYGSSGSSGVAGSIGVRPGCHGIHPGSLGSLGCALRVVVGYTLGVAGFIRVRLVHRDAIWGW